MGGVGITRKMLVWGGVLEREGLMDDQSIKKVHQPHRAAADDDGSEKGR